MIPPQVADAVAVGVGEAARVDLVDDGGLPPGLGHARGVGVGASYEHRTRSPSPRPGGHRPRPGRRMVRGRNARRAFPRALPRLCRHLRRPRPLRAAVLRRARLRSPRTVRELLEARLPERGLAPEDLVVLDVGAGNGMVGEQLSDLGASRIVGIDILPEAAQAAERDRPGVYDDYKVIDLIDPPPGDDAELSGIPFTCLTSVAALGFDDMPPEAFEQAFGYSSRAGWWPSRSRTASPSHARTRAASAGAAAPRRGRPDGDAGRAPLPAPAVRGRRAAALHRLRGGQEAEPGYWQSGQRSCLAARARSR